ncbi:hypothetical protein Pmani_023104 [Petrolisthes manimaculis]|uniref:Uncharacterized protein n=1 Tax=Petrolisthes manimaculis TaxID=1843537 RepID=A0AAE1U0I7_9EUCA|nr:hypothetical protein Pmani_023104 [Petrolisthes manimaculis]
MEDVNRLGNNSSNDTPPIKQRYSSNQATILLQSSNDTPPIKQRYSSNQATILLQSSNDTPPIKQRYSSKQNQEHKTTPDTTNHASYYLQATSIQKVTGWHDYSLFKTCVPLDSYA